MIPDKLTIFTRPAGAGRVERAYVHTDAIHLSDLGPKDAPRVSDVEWDVTKQAWVAKLRNGEIIAEDPVRDVVLKRERALNDEKFRLPIKSKVDFPLVVGAAIFGIGCAVQ